jgi:hypothetical protein
VDLQEFLRETQREVRSEVGERLNASGEYPYNELVFAEVVMQHMAEVGMTADPEVCHYAGKIGNANVRLSGYSLSEEGDQLDLFVSLYAGVDELTPVPDAETKVVAEQCLRFVAKCADGTLPRSMDAASDAQVLAATIDGCYGKIEQIRIYVLTDRVAKAKNFKAREIAGKTVKLEVMDIERLYRHWSAGKPRDELTVNFEEVCGSVLPCIYVPGQMANYDYALTAIPGEALYFLYEKYGARLLEANVRSFLSSTGKVNKGIQSTLRNEPERFLAYNNGIVLIADEARLGRTADGVPGISWLKGMQIVNGGQTTASVYFTKKKNPETDLISVRVPTKLIILRSLEPPAEEALISDISRYANSQNSVKLSDLSANKPYHIRLEQLALSTYIPDGVGRWFYERAAGSYNVLLAREGTTPAKLRQIREAMPSARKITKTDLAKYLNAWDQKPHLVSLGSQKNFDKFMEPLGDNGSAPVLDVAAFKQIIAKAILFKSAHRLVRPMFQAFQANVAAYLISVVANRVGHRVDLDKIWLQQEISPQFKQLLAVWAGQVNEALHATANGRMVSEWAKKLECWELVRSATYSDPPSGIPELR